MTETLYSEGDTVMARRTALGCIGILVYACVTTWMEGGRTGGGEILSLRTRGEYAAISQGRDGATEDDATARHRTEKEGSATAPIPLIHCTDIFHPPADPDDFWDLATVYALMKQGKVDLRGIVFDFRQPMVIETVPEAGDSAVGAIAQLNYLTGAAVPAAMGSSKRLESTSDNQSDAPLRDRAGVNLILRILRESSEPVAISVVGSSIDVALAANTAPDLFREKCRAVYLLAGTGTTDPENRANFCYNVRLDRTAFRSCFTLPCPLYWIPAFETVPSRPDWYFRVKVQRYGSFWRFNQREVLPFLSPPIQNYFIYALTHEKSPHWLRFLHGDVDGDHLEKVGSQTRYMWSTAALLHLAGMTVCGRWGRGGASRSWRTCCVPASSRLPFGRTNQEWADWRIDESSEHRFIFEVKKVDLYQSAMTKALKATLLYLE